MRLTLIACGRRKVGPEQALFDHYVDRLKWPLEVRWVEEKKALSGEKLKAREADLLLGAAPPGAVIVALDERGKALGSEDFADRLQRWQDTGERDIAFLIGGADGLAALVRDQSRLVLSFGKLTWPHQLVPALLAEQLYRAHCILSGHPYHRA